MSDYLLSEFATICRLCLKKDGVMSCIFNNVMDNGEFDPLATRITDFFHIQLYENDGLPSKICHRCLYKTEKSTKFRQQCLVNEAKLLHLVQLQHQENLQKLQQENADIPEQHTSSLSEELQQRLQNNQIDITGEYKNVTITKVNPPGKPEDSLVAVVDPNQDYNSTDESDGGQSDQANQETEFKYASMCKYCDIAFKEEDICHEHELNDHNAVTPFSCQLCSTMFAERNQLIGHMRLLHKKERPYICLQCDKGFARRSDLRKHTIVHTGVRPYSCYICTKAFSRNTNLTKHMRIHLGKKPHVCLKCSRTFISKVDLSRHMAVHTGAKPFVCKQCNMAFSRKDKLQRHEKKHDVKEEPSPNPDDTDSEHGMVININPYEQNIDDSNDVPDLPSVPDHISGETHDISDFLKAHMQEGDETILENGHPAQKKPYSCPQCPKMLSNLDNLRRHMYIHMGIKNHVCPICNKSFARKRELDRHSIVHTGFKPFACDMCDKRFGRKDKLIRHLRIHDEQNYFQCTDCDASFARKEGLLVHQKIHNIKTEMDFI